jgi:uncharacterized protein with beta-barrel porin domain
VQPPTGLPKSEVPSFDILKFAVIPVVMGCLGGALLPASESFAACAPPTGDNTTVTCSGATVNQGLGINTGYGDSTQDGVTVNIQSGASVTGTSTGIDLNNNNTINNSGTITTNGVGIGNVYGINGNGPLTVTNSGTIGRVDLVDPGNTDLAGINEQGTGLIVTNTSTGVIQGDVAIQAAGTPSVMTVVNSGLISGIVGGGGMGISGDNVTVTNNQSGTITADAIGINANTATIYNYGVISAPAAGSGGTAVNVNSLTLFNYASGTITGDAFGVSGSSTPILNVTNFGAISGTGLGGTGIGGNTVTLVNSGTVSGGLGGAAVSMTSGAITNNVGGAITGGISAFDNSSIFNAGTITSSGGAAIQFTSVGGGGGGNTLTIAPTSVINGNVAGSGIDTFQLGGTGSGTFNLALIGAGQQYQGFTTFNVVGGFWTVSNVFGQADAWNVNGGTLAGTGTLADVNVNTGGTLQPGTTPGTAMTITGNLAFQSGALYVVMLNATTSTLAKVSGTASLAGGVQALLQPGVTKQTYTILHSGGLGGTTFDSLTVAPGFTGTLTYTPTDVLLGLNANLGLGGNLNINQQNVANALNSFFNAGGALPAGFLPVFNLTGGNLQNALTQLSGEVNVDGQAVTFQQMTQFLTLMLDPFVAGRNGIGGGSGALGFAPEQEANFPSDIALAYNAILKAPPPKPATLDQRWTAWGTAYGGSDKTNGDPVVGSNTFTANTFGFAAGMDYHPAPDTILGFALAGGGTNWTLAQALGGGRSDAFQAGVYGTKYFGPAYVAGSFAVANNWMTTNRTALGDQLTSSFDAQSVGGRVEAGYRYAVKPAIGVTPYGALQAQSFHTPSRSEIDLTGGAFALNFAAMNATDTRSELGARFDGLTALDGLPLILRARLAWAHDWVSNPALGAVFQALPGASFVVNGAPLPANSALASAGAELKLNPHVSLLGKFDGEFANGSQTYAGTGTLRYTW